MVKLALDILGVPRALPVVLSTNHNTELRPVTLWGGRVAGPSHSTFPRPNGWWTSSPEEEDRLDEWTTLKTYKLLLERSGARPNCEENWKRYVREELPWPEIWASFLKPGIYSPHHFMTFFKV